MSANETLLLRRRFHRVWEGREMGLGRGFALGIIAALVALATAGSPLAVAARPFAAEDLTGVSIAQGAVMANDGRMVAFTVMRLDAAKNKYRHNIWLVGTAGGSARQLTRGDEDGDPQWTPDDRTIVFTSGRLGKSQIYRIGVDGGEAEKLTDAPHGASGPRISHDGTRIVFLRIDEDAPPRAHVDWKALRITPPAKERTSDLRHIDVLHFEDNGRGETFASHSHLALMNLDGSGQKQLTEGHFSETDPAWSPDDRTLVYVSARHAGNDYDRQDLYAIAAAGGTEHRIALTHRYQYRPVFLHDGRLAYEMNTQNDPAALPAVQIAALDGTHDTRVVTENAVAFGDAILADVVEGGAGCGPIFAPRDRTFVADVSVPGATELQRFDVATGRATTLVGGGGEVADCSMNENGTKIAYTFDDATHPPEVYVADARTGAARKLTNLNAALLRDVTLAPIEPFRVIDRAGFAVHAWMMKPPSAIRGRRYPTLLEIHGGPELEFGNAYFQELQFLAAQGYNVVFADPRGSVGFGYPFEAALSKNWGDPMFEDEMAVMDSVLHRPDVDPNRLGVLGGSYGGYATLWVVSHTNRFRAGIAERVCSDLVSEVFASDFAQIPSARYSWGAPWDDPLTYRKQSPLYHVAQVHTPLLMIHSDEDIRTPVDQTYEEYTALKALGKEVELVEFPRENHDLSRTGEPLHRIERLHLLGEYFARLLP